jgi:hypothetical protein
MDVNACIEHVVVITIGSDREVSCLFTFPKLVRVHFLATITTCDMTWLERNLRDSLATHPSKKDEISVGG